MVAVTAALLLSIAAGYLFSGMMAARMAGLEYYRAGGEAVAATAMAAPAAGKEGQGAAGARGRDGLRRPGEDDLIHREHEPAGAEGYSHS